MNWHFATHFANIFFIFFSIHAWLCRILMSSFLFLFFYLGEAYDFACPIPFWYININIAYSFFHKKKLASSLTLRKDTFMNTFIHCYNFLGLLFSTSLVYMYTHTHIYITWLQDEHHYLLITFYFLFFFFKFLAHDNCHLSLSLSFSLSFSVSYSAALYL